MLALARVPIIHPVLACELGVPRQPQHIHICIVCQRPVAIKDQGRIRLEELVFRGPIPALLPIAFGPPQSHHRIGVRLGGDFLVPVLGCVPLALLARLVRVAEHLDDGALLPAAGLERVATAEQGDAHALLLGVGGRVGCPEAGGGGVEAPGDAEVLQVAGDGHDVYDFVFGLFGALAALDAAY